MEVTKHATSHKLIEILLIVAALSWLFIYARLQSAERSQSRRFAFLSSREIFGDRLYMCMFILVFPSCLLLLGYLEGVRCICSSLYVYCVHTATRCVCFRRVCVIYLFHTHDLCSCSCSLLFLMLNDIRSFPFL